MSKSYYQVKDRWSVRAGQYLVYLLSLSVQRVLSVLPIWPVAGAFAWLGGWLTLALPGVRRRGERNLALIWPHLDRRAQRRLIRQAGAHFVRLAAEYSQLRRMAAEIEIRVDGIDHLRAAKASGKGAVLVTAHYGNWEAVRIAAKRMECEVGIIYRAFNNRYIDRFTMDLLPSAGTPVLQKGREGMRAMMAHVARGGLVLILVDQRTSGAPYIDFMGHPAETVTVAAELARRTGAALIPVRGRRDVAARRFDVMIEAPIAPDDGVTMMQAVNARIGAWVEETPEQWLWFHRRWRSTIRSRQHPDQPKA